MRRRLFLAAGAASVLASLSARAQSMHRIGFLSGGAESDVARFLASLLDALDERGYREGRNLVIDRRYAEYSLERAAKLAADIAAAKPALIVANGGGIGAAARLSPPVPVVFLHSGDPVEAAFADSYARPGRNATGLTMMALDLIPSA